ncbi:hypothetical protein Tco_0566363 [Tanacetum coccineum]
MSNRHQELTSPEQTAPALASPEQTATAMASPKQTAIGKELSNLGLWLIHATIGGHSLSITEGSLRRHLKLDDQDGLTSLPTTEIFAQLVLMGYATDSDKLTFQKGVLHRQWRFLIHNILHCLSPKKTAWEQFSSNIAAAVICLATNRKFNFSRMIFDHMVSNISSPHKFLMYPSNMKRSTKGFSGQEVPLFPTMLDATEPSPSPSRITSSPSPTPTPSPSPEPSPTQPSPTQPSPTQPSPTQLSPTQPGTEYHLPTPHDSPLHAVHSHGSEEGSLKLQELMNLVNTLSDRIGVLEADLLKTKKTYSSAYTKLILRVKKLESQIKIGKARKQTRVVISDDEAFEDDSSKQGRKLFHKRISRKSYEQRAQLLEKEIAKQWDEEERKRAMDEVKSTKEIDWNDPSVIRYHSLKMKPKTIAQAKRNMIKYLKNQGNFKITDFKGMSYNDIRLIFRKLWDLIKYCALCDEEKGIKKQKSPEKERSPEKIVEEKVVTQEEKEEVVKEPGTKRKKSIPRKSIRKRQKMEEDSRRRTQRNF